MNVFESIKGSFKNVQQDLYDGLKALTSLEPQPRHGVLRRLHSDGINLDAGADLLKKYQNTWKELQGTTVDNAQQAENVDGQIGLIFVRWDRISESMGSLESEVKQIPTVLSMISEISNTLGYVEERCRQVEAALERLEDVCEEEQMRRDENNHIAQLVNYRRKRRDEVEKVKVELAKTHAKTMQSYDRQRMSRQKEREEAFSEAFSEDINYYQTHGHIEKLQTISIPQVSSLSDITLEQDRDVLDKFLDSADADNSKDIPGTRKHGTSITEPDGTFFEDDYTTDYTGSSSGNIQQDSNTDNPIEETQNCDNSSKHISPKCDEKELTVTENQTENVFPPTSEESSSKLSDNAETVEETVN